jgi:hypothetical protein
MNGSELIGLFLYKTHSGPPLMSLQKLVVLLTFIVRKACCMSYHRTNVIGHVYRTPDACVCYLIKFTFSQEISELLMKNLITNNYHKKISKSNRLP